MPHSWLARPQMPARSVLPITVVLAAATASASPTALDRMLAGAGQDPRWNAARTIPERMRIIREVALKQDVVSNPVSDRYLITELGGPIDLVHFLGLAAIVASGKSSRESALLEQWRLEGGPDFIAGRSRVYPTEAHPDDLPSNALGALFGEETLPHANDPSFDLPAALKAFMQHFLPVPDAVAKRFSHQRIVMGLPDSASFTQMRQRSEWFTALPRYLLPDVAPKKVRSHPNAETALKAAGFAIRRYEGRPIIIDRLPAK
jgi:hypothetical protein